MTRIAPRLREQVRQRAHRRCEYCRKPEGFDGVGHQIDHIVPERHLGTSQFDNFAWACLECNHSKSTDIASYDNQNSKLVLLYHPRKDSWNTHFEIHEGIIVGKTPVGRVTIRILNMNSLKQVETRRALIENGLWN